MVIMRKIFDNHNNNIKTSPSNYTSTFDKFALKAINQLSYNKEISRLLVTSYLLNLLNHYFQKDNCENNSYCPIPSLVFVDIE